MASVHNLIKAIDASRDDAGPMEVQRLMILLEIAREPGISSTGLVEATGMPQQTVSRHVISLGNGRATQRGQHLVESIDDPHELRRKIHFLTQHGIEKITQIMSALNDAVFDFKPPTAKEYIAKVSRI